MNKKIQVKFAIFTSILAYLLPIILFYAGGGLQESISSYYYTDASIVYHIILITIALGFFTGADKYKIAGVLLLLVVFVSLEYRWYHNIIAFSFFVYTTIIIFLDKRFYLLSIPMILSLFAVNLVGLYTYEIISIYCIATFNMLYGLRYLKIINPQ